MNRVLIDVGTAAYLAGQPCTLCLLTEQALSLQTTGEQIHRI